MKKIDEWIVLQFIQHHISEDELRQSLHPQLMDKSRIQAYESTLDHAQHSNSQRF